MHIIRLKPDHKSCSAHAGAAMSFSLTVGEVREVDDATYAWIVKAGLPVEEIEEADNDDADDYADEPGPDDDDEEDK